MNYSNQSCSKCPTIVTLCFDGCLQSQQRTVELGLSCLRNACKDQQDRLLLGSRNFSTRLFSVIVINIVCTFALMMTEAFS